MKSVARYNKREQYKTTGKVTAFMLCRILFFGCFFVAIVLANTLWKNEASWIAYMYQNFCNDINIEKIDRIETFFCILRHRLPMWMFFLIFGRCRIGLISLQAVASWKGLLIGFAFASLLMRYGAFGIFLLWIMILPQFPLYLISYILICKKTDVLLRNKIRQFFLANFTFGGGVFLESYVNVIFLIKISNLLEIF